MNLMNHVRSSYKIVVIDTILRYPTLNTNKSLLSEEKNTALFPILLSYNHKSEVINHLVKPNLICRGRERRWISPLWANQGAPYDSRPLCQRVPGGRAIASCRF